MSRDESPPPTRICPEPETLRRFALGLLAEPASREVARHVQESADDRCPC